MIRIENLTKTHGTGERAVAVLHGLSCEIPTGAFCFIIGPSGSGKSTLLYLLGALDSPTSGQILIDGENIFDWSAERQDRFRRDDVGFVFQSFNLLSNLSALDNVLVPQLPEGIAPDIRRAAYDLLDQVGLSERIDHRPNQLSGGEQQRVAIARALLKNPRIVLADEPTGELDSENGRQVFEALRTLQRERNTTVITVTHDQRYIKSEDLVFEIQDGRFVHDRPAKLDPSC